MSEHAIECPYCGKWNDNLWEWQSSNMDADEDYECGYCEKVFRLERVTTVDYYATKKD